MIDEQLQKLEQTLDVVSKTHRADLVIDTAGKILAINPQHEQATHHLIFAYYNSQKFKEMFEVLQSSLSYFSHESWIHYACYLYYLSVGGDSYLKAKDHIERAIKIEPSNTQYYRSLGEIYLINREAEKAMPFLKKAVDLDPSFAEYRSRYALALLRMHKVKESLETADQALKDDPGEPWIYDTVGMIYTLAGELEKGEELFREALRKAPTIDYFQKHIDWVLGEKLDRQNRKTLGKVYTPLYLRHKGTKRFFDEDANK
ncbi:tetratricopeptide repeat protein [Candidatus Gottesmanbacteria bacterium]|nr:tetratricopeptide repeat protein [Candidatus Gottesmanbacteria bacterium]